ncbi:MAG: septum site-determining protein MinD [Clostridia bacterium]|nr:septum site-determining protein MinD [Clostridia bacterium]
MGTVISIVSGKGGVGKTTICANLAFALAQSGRTVIAIDGDMGLRNLDILLRMEDKSAYDLLDILEERCPISKGISAHDLYPNLHFISGADDYNAKIDRGAFRKLCRYLADHYEYVLIDAPAGVGEGFKDAVFCAHRCIVVSTPDLTAVRDASRTAAIILAERKMRVELIINKVRKQMIKKGYLQNVDQVMDSVALPLIGLVPHDEAAVISANQGEVLAGKKSVIGRALINIAGRLQGEDIPLASFWRKK